jgi:hypothetical protein
VNYKKIIYPIENIFKFLNLKGIHFIFRIFFNLFFLFFSLVVARYAGDRKCYRAWIKSVDIQHEQALVFFVDFGNESKVLFSDIYICPETVRTLPWLGVRVHLTGEKMTCEELTTFWKLTESHYIWIRVNEISKDSYGIQIKIDYSVYLRHERLKMLIPKRLINKSVQVN